MLREHRIMPSMSRPAHPHDNASCESFLKTLKREEIYANDYRDREDLAAGIEEFIERYYNRCRLHSALGYRSPEEFEKQAETESKDNRQMRTVWPANETVYPKKCLNQGFTRDVVVQARPDLYQNCSKTLSNYDFEGYFEREADSPKLLESLESKSKGRNRWSQGSCLQSRCSPS